MSNPSDGGLTHRRGAGALLFLHAHTSLHPGTGTALGTVDLPVQRERHTEWPLIPGSSLKGVLRDSSRWHVVAASEGRLNVEQADNDPVVTSVFGPPTERASDHAGALAVTDARILAFPVRSLQGVFAWVTCPGVLERFTRDAAIAGVGGVPVIPREVEDREALVARGCPCVVGDPRRVVLEEYEFEATESPELTRLLEWLAPAIGWEGFARTRERLKTSVVVVSDNFFTHYATHATEVAARIRLDYETKTVAEKALFYQEFLPPETIFYAVLLAQDSHQPLGDGAGSQAMKARSVLAAVEAAIAASGPPVLQIGGDESTGKGLCVATLLKGGERDA